MKDIQFPWPSKYLQNKFNVKGNQNLHIKLLLVQSFNYWGNPKKKFEQNRLKNMEVTAFEIYQSPAGDGQNGDKLRTTIHYVLYIKFIVSPPPLFLVTDTISFPEIKIWQARMYFMWHIMRSGHENKQIRRKIQSNDNLSTKWMESCPQLSHNLIITALSCLLYFKKL